MKAVNQKQLLIRTCAIGVLLLTASNCSALADKRNESDIHQVTKTLNKALHLMAHHRSADAVALLRQGLESHPRSASLHFELGNALCDCRQYRNAIAEYDRVLQLELIPEAVINMAYAYCNAGMPSESVPWFQRFIAENPNHPRIAQIEEQMLVAQSSSCMENQRAYDAKKLLERALALNPNDTIAHFKLARACEQLGDANGAIQEYEQVLRLQPNHNEAIFNIAGCYQSLGRAQDAEYWFAAYLKENPDAADRQTVLNMITKLKEKGAELTISDPAATNFCQAVAEHGNFYRWPPERIPLSVYIYDGQDVPGYRENFRAMLLDSLNAWIKASQGKLAYRLANAPSDADITCSWTGNPFEIRQTNSDVEQGICKLKSRGTSSIDGTISIESAVIRILTLDRETQKPLPDDDMKKTCLHEIGHALGLHGHSNNNHDIMFFSMSPTVWPVLSKRDKATLRQIYAHYPTLTPPPGPLP